MLTEELVLIFNTEETPDCAIFCIACCEETINVTKCCRAPVCKVCYIEWLKQKRQCMHCKADQCSFRTWMDNYRVEPDFDPQEYLHELMEEMQHPSGNPHLPNFTIADLLGFIQNHLSTPGAPQISMENPTEILSGDYTLEYGFTATPTNQQGVPTGPGITVAQTLNDDPEQMQAAMQQYQDLFSQYQDQNTQI